MSEKQRQLFVGLLSFFALLHGYSFGLNYGWLYGVGYSAFLILFILFLWYVITPDLEQWVKHGSRKDES